MFIWLNAHMINSTLLDVNNSLLIVIDIQPSFVKKESEDGSNALLQRICWLIKAANWLKVPLVVTAEDIPDNGSASNEVAEVLPLGSYCGKSK